MKLRRALGLTIITTAVSLLATASVRGGSIVGGESISITEAPWQVFLGDCGGVWVGGRNVLTAQHCTDTLTTENAFVWAGITRRDEATVSNRLRVERIIRKNPRSQVFEDITVLKLAEDITAPLARPIRYATPEDVAAGYTDKGTWCAASGWGYTRPDAGLPDSLQWVESKIKNPPDSLRGVIQWAAEGGNEDKGACNGDSGGPLVVRDGSGELILVGLASHLHSYCGNPTQPSSYCRVSAFADWLLEQGVPQPTTTPVRFRFSSAASEKYFTLEYPQTLFVSVFDLTGREVRNHSRFYPAGRHALPARGLSSGRQLLWLRGGGVDIRRWVTPLNGR